MSGVEVVEASSALAELSVDLSWDPHITLPDYIVVLSAIPSINLYVVNCEMNLNVFRVLGDLAHLSSKCILIWAIHRNKSSEGISFLTQLLYAVVFITRYLDLFQARQWSNIYLVSFKVFYLLSSGYTILLMFKVFPRTREKEKSWKLAFWSVIGSAAGAPIMTTLLYHKGFPTHLGYWLIEAMWTFSIILESVSVLPQLILLRQTNIPTVIDSYYLLSLGSYRLLYIPNWIYRGFGLEKHWDPISGVFGVIQTAFYIDFAWVYYSRQRVKLRNGGIIDSDDFQKGWLVHRVFSSWFVGNLNEEQPLDTEAGDHGRRKTANRWGARSVSISADDPLDDRSLSQHPEAAADSIVRV